MEQDTSGVWILSHHKTIGYSDGSASDAYLRRIFESARNLGSRSEELEGYIHDWPSEYHLTRKRSQLLSGFSFDKRKRVLEVGCGCGAITRFLGEVFDEVVSVEGDLSRARLARLRTRDQDNIAIVCAPFHLIEFSDKFDVIFCVGVFEYSGLFVDDERPYESIIDYFSSVLTDDGVLVLAIENQFGLKYFCGASEDHSGLPFDGIEGYVRKPGGARTFGKHELGDLLNRHFSHQQFYYPYPDYKVPDMVLSEEFLASGRAGEMISQVRSRDYSQSYHPLWLESSSVAELNRNHLLDIVANSFLVIAGKSANSGVSFPQQGIFYSPRRRPLYATQTRIVARPDGQLQTVKERITEDPQPLASVLRQRLDPSEWVDASSLQTQLLVRAASSNAALADIFAPAGAWVDTLRKAVEAESGRLPGKLVDAIWGNAYLAEGRCTFIDLEWEWHEPLPLGVLVIRAAFDLLHKAADAVPDGSPLVGRSGRKMIRAIAECLGVTLSHEDFDAFINLESAIQSEVFGLDREKVRWHLRWFLFDRVSLQFCGRIKRRMRNSTRRLSTLLASRLAAEVKD
ncbi:class I SAM-dependent methyltransferase [Pseudolabrys sp.]|uniref:class I SAM-dependent methyltransferase n=1 Tax=Pseudolabrys sp. TaxID=1960880 RepID=UPI003D10EE3F